MDIKLELKEEPLWLEIKTEPEVGDFSHDNSPPDIQDNDSRTAVLHETLQSKLSRSFSTHMMRKRRKNWDEAVMKCAIRKVMEDGLSIREASSRFSVPKSTLGDRIKIVRTDSSNRAPHSMIMDIELEIKEEPSWLEIKAEPESDDFSHNLPPDIKDNDSRTVLLEIPQSEFSRSSSRDMARERRGKWNEGDMKCAIRKVMEDGMPIREASLHFSVPKSTLGDRIKGLRAGNCVSATAQMGHFQKTFSEDLEFELVKYTKELDNMLMPLNKREFLLLAYALAERLNLPHQFNKQRRTAGPTFYYNFMSRHPELSLRTKSKSMKVGFNRMQVDLFFSKYKELYSNYNFQPCKIFNCGETSVSVLEVLSQKGKKQVGERKRNVTVLLSINASGDQFLPPLFVFPRKRMDNELKKDAPEGSVFVAEESSQITAACFLKWLQAFVKRVHPTKKEPALLILAGHDSHKDPQVVFFTKQNNIHMISVPPYTRHKLQPVDRVVLGLFKRTYIEAYGHWLRRNHPLKITLRDIAGLVNTAFAAIHRKEIAHSGFSCTGLHPLNPNVFTDLDFNGSVERTADHIAIVEDVQTSMQIQ